MRFYRSLYIVLLAFIQACSSLKDELKIYKEQGWTLDQTLGEEGPFTMVTTVQSETASAIIAHWVENGVRMKRSLPQTKYRFLILSFVKSDNDVFSVVLKKPR